MSDSAVRSRSRQASSRSNCKHGASITLGNSEGDDEADDKDEESEEKQAEDVEEEESDDEEEEDDEEESDPLLAVESTSLSRVAYEERARVPLPSVSIRWVSPLNKTFSSRKSAWENAVHLCKQECLIDKVLKGRSARGEPLKPARPAPSAALAAGKLRFERDGLWVVGQEETWQRQRLEEASEKGQADSSRSAGPKHQSPLTYYLMCNRKEHLKGRKAELLEHHLPSAEADEVGSANDAGTPVRFTYRDAERELRTKWQQLTVDEREEWAGKCKAHHQKLKINDGCEAIAPTAILWVSDEDTRAPVTAPSSREDRPTAGMVSPSPPPTVATFPSYVVTPESGAAREEKPSRGYQESTRWRMTPEQCRLCYEAGMEHFDQVMRTVQARDLARELQDGFDVLRERGRRRYDMELPAFEAPTFSFLSDLQKAPWMPIVREILGKDVVLIHKGMFLALPGADRQVYHQDGLHLTTNYQRDVHAINVFIPVVDLTTELGPTQFCLGSHLLGNEDYDDAFVESPVVKAGTPIIFDYRLGHRGLANTSHNQCRPIVYCTYARATDGKEFRDTVNFSRKRYHKIGNLVEKAASREERARKRDQSSDSDARDSSVKKRLCL
jgi:hypothetical protein